MFRKLLLVLLSFAIGYWISASFSVVRADELSDIENQLGDLKKALQMSVSATTPLEKDLTRLQAQLDSIKKKTSQVEADIVKKQAEVTEGEHLLGLAQELLNEKVKSWYKSHQEFESLGISFLFKANIQDAVRSLGYQKKIVEGDRDTIVKTVLYIKDLEDKKAQLENEKVRLTAIKEETDKQAGFLQGEISKAKSYQATLSQKIASLTAQQQAIIAQRQAGLNLPKSAYTSQGGCSSDLTNGKNPGFSSAFGFFSYGVPHRVGLNQYGAKGRAEAGQSARQILEAYYNAEYKEGYNTSINIHVVGTNEYGQTFDTNWSIEDYLKHVYEVPTNWSSEALKAQAIAARSYALSYTNNGQNNICPSQSCQVVKQEENSDAWKQAVEQTKGIVLLNGGNPISAYFSSTAGGYAHDSSNDISSRPWTKNTQDGKNSYNSFDDVKNNAYDKDSPWFYCDWGARSEYGGTAWLKSEEVADIVNAILLVRADSSTSNHVGQPDKPTGDTWDQNRLKEELRKRNITPFNNINSVSISADFGYGKTNSISFNGDAGEQSFDGKEFKDFFNVRAPANIQIVGPLYNVEKK